MKINFKTLVLLIFIAFVATSCSNDKEPFDQPFVYITDDASGSSAKIDSEGTFVATYSIYLSSKAQHKDVVVEYDIIVGDGLIKDKDYKLISSTSSPVTFSPGIYVRPIRIEWLKNKVDVNKDNTFKIVLRSCSNGSTLGFPGPDRNHSEYLITKY